MNRFNVLVSEQLKIMDQLLYIQSEIEEQIQENEVEETQGRKERLKYLQEQFQQQTEAVINSFKEEKENGVVR